MMLKIKLALNLLSLLGAQTLLALGKKSFLIVATVLLVSCTSVNHQGSLSLKPYLDTGVQVSLPPAQVVPPVEFQEVLDVTYQNQSHSLIVMFKSDGHSLTLTGLSHLGIKLFGATYSNQGLQTEQFINIKELPKPEQVLLDVLLGHAPLEAWHNLLPQNYKFTQQDNRRILVNDQGRIIYEIDLTIKDNVSVPTKLKNHNFGYEISISYL